MRRNEWVILVVVYVCATVSAFAIVRATKTGDLGLAAVVGAIVGTQAAGWMYHRRNREASPIGFRLLIGLALACLWVATVISIRWIWASTVEADAAVGIALIGTALTPLVLIG